MTRLAAVVIALMLAIPQSVAAQECSNRPGTAVIFGNGANTDFVDAVMGMEELQAAITPLAAVVIPQETLRFGLAYNQNEGVVAQLMELWRQRQANAWSDFWRSLGNLSFAPRWFTDAMNELSANVDLDSYVRDEDLQAHVQRYRTEMLEGNNVVVVGHSQGNMYANQAHTMLFGGANPHPARRSFGVVAAGTPASYVAGGGPYTTLSEDHLIASVRVLYPSTLAGNAENDDRSGADFLNHSWHSAYLGGDVAGPRIRRDVVSAIMQLEHPDARAGNGIMTVTLEWAGSGDVDLHVFEPGSQHIYYDNQQGRAGAMDVDDTDGAGPEHYFVRCDRLLAGTYELAVNYYSGDAPETATLQVRAGNVFQSFTVDLPRALGNTGDQDPQRVARIQVVPAGAGFNFAVSAL